VARLVSISSDLLFSYGVDEDACARKRQVR